MIALEIFLKRKIDKIWVTKKKTEDILSGRKLCE